VAILTAYGREITSVFQLLGYSENGVTTSIAWVLKQCPVFLRLLVQKTCGDLSLDYNQISIKNQEYEDNAGISITDIEITDDNTFHLIFEAKRGWWLPGIDQLMKYAKKLKFHNTVIPLNKIITLSECSRNYAESYLPAKEIEGIPIEHLSWKDIYYLAGKAKSDSNHAEKRLLCELEDYLKGVTTMQIQTSNEVYVVSLSSGHPNNCELTWKEIVTKKNRYTCPQGNNWPKDAPNYIAFRYDGKLQSIHHVENYIITRNRHDGIPEMESKVDDYPSFIFTIGPAIITNHEVRTGNIFRAGRVWCMLDTLLTCQTISEARDETQRRKAEASERSEVVPKG
jgi:hypothetical protein